MASLSLDSQGRRQIQFAFNGKRHSIRLGRISQDAADVILAHIEHLQSCLGSNRPWCPGTSQWVDCLRADATPGGLLMRLVGIGLLPSSYAPAQAVKRDDTLGSLLERYVGKRGDVKPATQINWRHTRRNLMEYFGTDKCLREISEGDAEDWRRWLITKEKLADNTVNKRCQNAKQFFAYAVRHRMVQENPFAILKGATRGNPKRMYFVTREQCDMVLAQLPDAQWRLIFALCRFGGLRCPTEVLLLRWQDVDWENDRFIVHSPKTEHHPGGDTRVVPMFPELKPYFEDAFETAPQGAEFVITRYRFANQNLRTQLNRYIHRAGLTPWPKLFQNLRSSRQTELANHFPAHVVCKWVGNSVPVAQEHYLQTTVDHYARAAQLPTGVLHFVLQYDPVNDGMAVDKKPEHPEIPREYGVLQVCTDVQMGGTGFEPLQDSLGKTDNSAQGAAFGAAVHHDSGASDPELACVLAAWPYLDDAQRKRILAVVRQAAQG